MNITVSTKSPGRRSGVLLPPTTAGMILPSGATLADLQDNPEAMITAGDLRSAGVGPSSYTTLRRWIAKGAIPAPIRLPDGSMRFHAGGVLERLGVPLSETDNEEEEADAA